MAKTAASIKKVPCGCFQTINNYAEIIHAANEKYEQFTQQMMREEYTKKLRGYLTCLKDLGLIEECDLKNIYLWVVSGHWIGDKEGKIDD